MTYIDLINEFWKKNQVFPLSSTDIAFYFYLLKECNSAGWENPFRLPTRKICFELNFRKDTITSVRNSLKQKGFIDFKKGDRRASDPEYSILDKDGVLVKIAYQNTYQNMDQNMYQNAYQNAYQNPSPTPPILKNKEISSDEDIKKVCRSVSERRKDFNNEVSPYIPKYGQKMIDEFCDYWTKEVETDVMRYETQDRFFLSGRLATWAKNNMTIHRTVTDIEEKTKLYNIDWSKVKSWYVGLGLVMEKWTDKRKRAYLSVFESYGYDVSRFREAIIRFGQEVKQSDWILGLAGSPMRDFEWLFTPDNFTLVIDGRYRKNLNLRNNENNSTREKDRRGTPINESIQNVDYTEEF